MERTLDDYAFLYTTGKRQRGSDIRFMMTVEDAQEWCSSDISKGIYLGNPWHYMWTSVKNYCFCHWGQARDATLDLRKMTDNGKWDEKINSLGLIKYGAEDIKRILEPLGIEVIIVGDSTSPKTKKPKKIKAQTAAFEQLSFF